MNDTPHTRKTSVFVLVAAAVYLVSECCLGAANQGANATSTSRDAHRTVYFEHRDEQLLASGQRKSGVAYYACNESRPTRLPLLVLLHGINEARVLYPWFGGSHDLRPTFDAIVAQTGREFVVAAPTQTKNAWLAATMWEGFDLRAFVADLSAALPDGCAIDWSSVYVAGHSAAGCNPTGGLATAGRVRADFVPAGVAFIDTCFDVPVARQTTERHANTRVWVLWQALTWQRDLRPFVDALTVRDLSPVKLNELEPKGLNPHVNVMYTAVEMLVHEWLLGHSAPPTVEVDREERGPIAAARRTSGKYGYFMLG